eukprot:gnl/Spiro4/25029_TR12443_c0_g1_i1.p1 gnl/Spiro4/25029_TR12443_c0_g1~~gnl/Spiro4/25029_TR12443_c0_g1_i1.p1  ORF type:complete len:516 (-),score=119.23 gnl/Spiro4/25029_TR12443_c0_g1_i1:80-1627(-)
MADDSRKRPHPSSQLDEPSQETQRSKMDATEPHGASADAAAMDVGDIDISHETLFRRKTEQRSDCPYLDTVNRQLLDFDFEKVCSVSLVSQNVYACLVCGKYFQGRGKNTHAYFHSLEQNHHVFMHLENSQVYCLPDGYEVVDSALDDIKALVKPPYTTEMVLELDAKVLFCSGLDDSTYVAGVVGLNNLKKTDFVNVALQALAHITSIRNYFLVTRSSRKDSPVVRQTGDLMRKMWNRNNFKGHVSPHELMQAITLASQKRFIIGVQSDPIEFLQWLLDTLDRDLRVTYGPDGRRRRRRSTIISDSFEGEIRVYTEKRVLVPSGPNRPPSEDYISECNEKVTTFRTLGLEVPPSPLFKDSLDRNILPQVQLPMLLNKFNGTQFLELPLTSERKRFIITRLPAYLVLTIKRFSFNTQLDFEKNPTVVNFPVRNLDMLDYTENLPATACTKYDLVANIYHEGQPADGSFNIHLFHRANEQWYDVQDLSVREVMPQLMALVDSYILVYRRHDVPANM